jgi:hypothetical protein
MQVSVMNEWDILNRVEKAKAEFSTTLNCAKLTGAITAQILKDAIQSQGIITSNRDIFIRGIPVEFDLIIPRLGADAELELVYEPQDILAVLEIKNAGSFGSKTIEKVRNDFQAVRQLVSDIFCAYVTLYERKTFSYIVTKENVNGNVYTLFWRGTSKRQPESTGDYTLLINDLQAEIARTSI